MAVQLQYDYNISESELPKNEVKADILIGMQICRYWPNAVKSKMKSLGLARVLEKTVLSPK